MTNKDKVREVYPEADVILDESGAAVVFSTVPLETGSELDLGFGATEELAWESAMNKIKEKK